MKEVIIIILLLSLLNTFLLLKHLRDCKKHDKESYFPVDRLSTRVGEYDGITSCSGVGARNVYEKGARGIGDDSFIFNGFEHKTV